MIDGNSVIIAFTTSSSTFTATPANVGEVPVPIVPSPQLAAVLHVSLDQSFSQGEVLARKNNVLKLHSWPVILTNRQYLV